MKKIKNKLFNTSIQKLNIISKLLRKQTMRSVIIQLEFCRRKTSLLLYNLILETIHNFNKNGLNLDSLYVKEIKLSKLYSLKRFSVRARGKINKISKPFTKITFILENRC